MLRYMDDLAPTEIAQTLDMSLNTVKSHLRRGLLVLRTRLQRESRR
jgi:DNA-directed RNA polymerase specialized sigma24 family protein